MKPSTIKKRLRSINNARGLLDEREEKIRNQCDHNFVKIDRNSWGTATYECKICGKMEVAILGD